MKANELRDKTVDQLNDESHRLRRELFDLRFQHGTSQLMDTSSLRRTRRDLARVHTLISEKQKQI